MKIIKVLLCLVALAGIVSSRKINSNKATLINESCFNDSKCGAEGKLICVTVDVTHTCTATECTFNKGKSLCKLKPGEGCTEDQQCSSHKCEKQKCSDYKRKFLEDCTHSFFWNECEQNTICSEKYKGVYKCLGAPEFSCKKDEECANHSCGTGLFAGRCNSFGGKVLRDTVSYLFEGVSVKKILH
jgi:hypothetical protein